MAGYRQIHTKIWKDEWFIELSTDEKLLFIYLFSNDEASITGLYKLPIRVMMNETGLSKEVVEAALKKFNESGKVIYQDGVIWVVRMGRYHANASVTTMKRMTKDIAMIPNCEVKSLYLRSLDNVSIPHQYGIDGSSENSVKEEAKLKAKTKSETKSESESETKAADADSSHPIHKLVSVWSELFPNKPQPRTDTESYRKKVGTRWKNQYFQDKWKEALEIASRSPTCQGESWFTFEFFIRNDENYQKCLENWMEWKDKNLAGNGHKTRDPLAGIKEYMQEVDHEK